MTSRTTPTHHASPYGWEPCDRTSVALHSFLNIFQYKDARRAAACGMAYVYLELDVTLEAPQKNMATRGMPMATRAPVLLPYLPCRHTGVASGMR